MKATVIAMASAKGGSGKTLITATFGTFLAELGKRVLMIDTDAATNGLSLFYIDRITERIESAENDPRGLFEELSPSDIGTDANLIEITENLYLLPATYKFHNTESADLTSYRSRLEAIVGRHRVDFDFVFLDAQAGSDAFAEAAISTSISDQVIIVSEYDPMSAAGVERLKAIFSENLAYHRTWILLNKMLPSFIKSFSSFMEIVKYLSPLPWSEDVVLAYARRTLPLELSIGNDYTLAVIQTLQSILDERTRIELEEWLNSRASDLRNPIKRQLADARRELSALRERRKKLSRRRQLSKLAVPNAAVLAGLAAGLLYYIFNGHAISAAVAFGGGLAAVLTVAGAAIFRLYEAFSAPYAGEDLANDIKMAEARVHRLGGLSDVDRDELLRWSAERRM
jgi:cellulose biosynthesis protein BcsQ